MKTAGIVGGIAPESTIVYYREIVKEYLKLNGGREYPRVIINSIDMNKMLSFIPGNISGLAEYLSYEIKKLKAAGADFAVLASNTPHIAFDEIKRKSVLPLLSIVELTLNKALYLGLDSIGLLGTKFTMGSHFYKDLFEFKNISLFVPNEEEQNYIHKIYFDELVKGVFLPETKKKLLQIVDSLRLRHNIKAVILGGTELPLILSEGEWNKIVFLDTTKIHVEGIIKKMTEAG